MIECDDGGPGATSRRLGHEVVEQVGMAAMKAIEHADNHEGGTERGA